MKKTLLLCGFAVGLLLTTPAHAVTTTIEVTLDGAQSGVASPGTGSATVIVDDVANTLFVSLTYQGLLYPTIDAHIHCCADPSMSAPVIIPFVPPFVLGDVQGSFEQTFAISDEQEMQVLSGLSYINIHTTVFPAGEIRGNILPAPEPSTFAVLAVGLAALSARGWRRGPSATR